MNPVIQPVSPNTAIVGADSSVLYILNLALSKGIVPSEWKLAKVIPVYKSKGSVTKEGQFLF